MGEVPQVLISAGSRLEGTFSRVLEGVGWSPLIPSLAQQPAFSAGRARRKRRFIPLRVLEDGKGSEHLRLTGREGHKSGAAFQSIWKKS